MENTPSLSGNMQEKQFYSGHLCVAFVRLSSTVFMIMLMIMIIIIFNLATSAKHELLTKQQPRFQTSGQKRPTGTFSFCRGLQNVLFKVSLCTGYFFF